MCYFMDFYNLFKYDKNNGLWAEDGLHFSPDGYDRMGEILFEFI